MSCFSIFQLSHPFMGKSFGISTNLPHQHVFIHETGSPVAPLPLALWRLRGHHPPGIEISYLCLKWNLQSWNWTSSNPIVHQTSLTQHHRITLFALFPQMIWFDTKGLWNPIRSKILLSQCATAIVAPTSHNKWSTIWWLSSGPPAWSISLPTQKKHKKWSTEEFELEI